MLAKQSSILSAIYTIPMPLGIAQISWLGKLTHEKYFAQEDITRKY
jgi:hypothetical protein